MIHTLMIMIMSMGETVPELRPPTGLVFIPQLIHQHLEPRWNNIDRAKLRMRPPELSGNPNSRVI
jgi:hypothetical protein